MLEFALYLAWESKSPLHPVNDGMRLRVQKLQMWRVYQRGLERWLADLLQPVFDNLVAEVAVPRFVQRLRILEFTLDHEAPTFSQMRRRSSRKDSDLNGVVNVRYTGGARMLLLIEVGQGRWRFKVKT